MKWTMTLDDIISATRGRILQQKFDKVYSVGTDTRKDLNESLFIALRGNNFDAHDFLLQAVQKGSYILLIDKDLRGINFPKDVTVVQVQDTLKGLQDLGHFWRKKQKARILAITGSNGKTSTKDFTLTLMRPRLKVYASAGSFNNHWGLPLSLLNIQKENEVAIIELGMNHLGELADLTRLSDPDVVAVTTVGRAHLEGLGSIENVAKAKEEIYLSSRPDTLAIFNLDNVHTKAMWEGTKKTSRPWLTFSCNDYKADVFFRCTKMDLTHLEIEGHIASVDGQANIPVFGQQNITNLMAASALALAVGLKGHEVWERLAFCQTTWGRNQLLQTKQGAYLVFDGYNANPDSVEALLTNIKTISGQGRKILILGEMLEMGAESSNLHEEIGAKASSVECDIIWFIGPHNKDFAKGVQSGNYNKCLFISDSYDQDLAKKIMHMIEPQDLVFVKGSRGMKLERVVQDIGCISFEKQ